VDELKPLAFWIAFAALLTSLTYCAETRAEEPKPEVFALEDRAGNSITLFPGKCPSVHLWFALWKRAVLVWQKNTYQACWRLQDDTVVILDSAGDVSTAPARSFRRKEGI